jgi:hypothetical protein
VQEIEYVVVRVGETSAVPEVAPFVEKLVPVQNVALAELHVISACTPAETLDGLITMEAVTVGP